MKEGLTDEKDLILNRLLGFLASQQHIVNLLKSLINIGFGLCSCKDQLARHKDKQDNLGLLHFIDETGKHLWLVLFGNL
jgi:hypothetical protein